MGASPTQLRVKVKVSVSFQLRPSNTFVTLNRSLVLAVNGCVL